MARAVPVAERDVTTQLQIFLDQQLFGPGKIDGRPGEFLTKALIRYQRAHGLPETGVLDANIPLDSVFPVYTFYTFTEEDLKFVGECPTKPAGAGEEEVSPLHRRCSSSSPSATTARRSFWRRSTRA